MTSTNGSDDRSTLRGVEQPDPIIAAARALGAQHGENAASWVTIDEPETAIAWLEDERPLDELPTPDLSGEMAGEPTGPDIYREIYEDAGATTDAPGIDIAADADDFTGVLDAYEESYREAAETAVMARAREVLANSPIPVIVEVDGAAMEFEDTYDAETVRVVLDEDGLAHDAQTFGWANSARISLDARDNAITVAISTGDPHGAFTMTIRRMPDGSPDAGRLIMHLPHPGDGMAHEKLTELHPGTFLIG